MKASLILKRAKKTGVNLKELTKKLYIPKRDFDFFNNLAIKDYKSIKIGDILYCGFHKLIILDTVKLDKFSLSRFVPFFRVKKYIFRDGTWIKWTLSDKLFCSDMNLINGGYNNELLFDCPKLAEEYMDIKSELGYEDSRYQKVNCLTYIKDLTEHFSF